MAYTVKQLAVMSGVTVRTLHFYDEMALLKPAYTKRTATGSTKSRNCSCSSKSSFTESWASS